MDALRIGKGTLTDSLANIDDAAVPASKVRYVKALTLCNKTATARWVTITLAGINVLYKYRIPGEGITNGVPHENTITIGFLDQVMVATDRIQGQAEVVTAIDFYISGREVTV